MSRHGGAESVIDRSQPETTSPPAEAWLRLRTQTGDMHRRVDAAFAAFDLTDSKGYARALTAHARVVPALERALAEVAATWSGWSPRSELLGADLSDLGHDMPPAGSTQALSSSAAWGAQYVLEGSKLGGQVLARRVGAGMPRRYLSVGFESGGWRAFQAELAAAALLGGARWEGGAIDAARAVFVQFEAAAQAGLDQAP
jgi:heme oxygenase